MEAIIFAIAGGITAAIVAKVLPSLVNLSKFSYSNAKFAAIPVTFLKEKEISRLLEVTNIEELKNNVASREFVLKGEKIGEIQESIDDSLFNIIKMAKKDSPKNVSQFYDAYMKKLDCYAVKEALFAIKRGGEIENKARMKDDREMIEKIKANPEMANDILKEYGWQISIDKSEEEIERDVELMAIKFLEDVKLKKVHKKLVDKFIKSMIDVLNLRAILRGKYYGLPIYLYGEGWEISKWKLDELLKIDAVQEIVSMMEGTSYYDPLKNSITEFEKHGVIAFEIALDKALLKIARDIANDNPLGIGPGIRFVIEKEMEARNLKIVVKAVGEGMPDTAKKLVVVE